MQSLREIYRIGCGPSSSHTMGPARAAAILRQRYPQALRYRVTLYGSLAATGKGHLTDTAIAAVLAPAPVDFVWKPDEELPLHPNGLLCEALDAGQQVTGAMRVYSPGGGAIKIDGEPDNVPEVYAMQSMQEILHYCTHSGITLWEYVQECEGMEIWDHLSRVNQVMHARPAC
jgi:L-serine dehydratase